MGATRLWNRGRRSRDGRGAAAVEFALVVPMLFLLVFGMIDFGYAINRYAMVNNAAREGVRAASLLQDEAAVTDAVTASAGDGLGSVDVELTCQTASGTSCAWSDAASGGLAMVKVEYDTSWLTPIGSLFSDELQISKTTRMRIE